MIEDIEYYQWKGMVSYMRDPFIIALNYYFVVKWNPNLGYLRGIFLLYIGYKVVKKVVFQ